MHNNERLHTNMSADSFALHSVHLGYVQPLYAASSEPAAFNSIQDQNESDGQIALVKACHVKGITFMLGAH